MSLPCAAYARANKRIPVCFVRRKLNWNDIIFNLKIQAKTSLFLDKVKSLSTLVLSLASPSAQIWHNLSWVHRSSLSFPCYQRLIYGSASAWEEAPCCLEEFPAVEWWDLCLLCLTASSILHCRDLSQKNLLCNSSSTSISFASRGSQLTSMEQALEFNMQPFSHLPHNSLLTNTAKYQFTNSFSVHHSALQCAQPTEC